jgi:hypothetical protein
LEIVLGVLCVVVTSTAFFLFVFVWKLGTELLYVPAQAYGAWWEVIERGGSYAAPLLWIGFQRFLRAQGSPLRGLLPRSWPRMLGGGLRRPHARTVIRAPIPLSLPTSAHAG